MFISLYRNWNNIATVNSNILKYNVKVKKNYLKQFINQLKIIIREILKWNRLKNKNKNRKNS